MSEVQKGDHFLVTDDMKAIGATHWKAPFTSGFECIVPKGTILVVNIHPAYGAKGFICLPKNREEFELKFVPEEDRTADGYAGFSLVVLHEQIGLRLEKI